MFEVIESKTGKVIATKSGSKNQIRKWVAKSMKVGTWKLKELK
jgi:TusA-related sulfurtransferase